MLVEFFCQIRKIQDRNFKNKRNDIEYSAKLRCEVVVAILILSKLAIQIKASLYLQPGAFLPVLDSFTVIIAWRRINFYLGMLFGF